jgi:kumamolisin
MRSVPDVVASADPESGVFLCQASAGGCPTGLIYGGTSGSAPVWAAFAALLNQALGANLGAFNQAIYPLANTKAFNSPASMGSDFAHVGVGSPNLNAMKVLLAGQTPGPASAEQSEVFEARSICSVPAGH